MNSCTEFGIDIRCEVSCTLEKLKLHKVNLPQSSCLHCIAMSHLKERALIRERHVSVPHVSGNYFLFHFKSVGYCVIKRGEQDASADPSTTHHRINCESRRKGLEIKLSPADALIRSACGERKGKAGTCWRDRRSCDHHANLIPYPHLVCRLGMLIQQRQSRRVCCR